MDLLANIISGPCYVIYVKSGSEKSIKENIKNILETDNRDIDIIVPLYEKIHIKNNIINIYTEILFPGYVFIFGNLDDELYYKIKNNINIYKFLKDDNDLLEIPKEEWHLLGELCNSDGILKTSKVDFDRNDKIVIIEGPLKKFLGNIVSVNKHKRYAYIEMHILNKMCRIKMPFEYIGKL